MDSNELNYPSYAPTPLSVSEIEKKRGRGRPPGSKNKSTLARQAIAENSLDIILDNLQDVLTAVVVQAKGGCLASQKLLIDKAMPTKTIQEITTAPDAEFKVTVTNNTVKPKPVEGIVVEAIVTNGVDDEAES